jgi:hypothetical protein
LKKNRLTLERVKNDIRSEFASYREVMNEDHAEVKNGMISNVLAKKIISLIFKNNNN